MKETLIAKSSFEYHNKHIKNNNLLIPNEDLMRFIEDFYSHRLSIILSKKEKSELRDLLKDPNTILIEVAHGAQLPHLGLVRLVLKAYHISCILPKSCVLYFIGDHYSAEMLPECNLFGLPLRGVTPKEQKRPITFEIGRKKMHIPLKWVNPPSDDIIGNVGEKVKDWLINNESYERKSGNYVKNKEKIIVNIEGVIDILKDSVKDVHNYADWTIRVQRSIFKEIIGDSINKIIFLPFSELYKLVDNEYRYILQETEVINKIKKEVSKSQIKRGFNHYQRYDMDSNTSCFWVYCPKCKRRGRSVMIPNTKLKFTCKVCGTTIIDYLDNLWHIVMPDIVAFEMGLLRLGIGGWVVGSKASYQEVIENTYKSLYNIPMPPRFLLNSVPIFRGIGDPKDGYDRTTLLRSLMEVSGRTLYEKLISPWNEDPFIKSEFLISKNNAEIIK